MTSRIIPSVHRIEMCRRNPTTSNTKPKTIMSLSFEARPRPGRRRQCRGPAGASLDAALALRGMIADL
jgi:hypothetical protein